MREEQQKRIKTIKTDMEFFIIVVVFVTIAIEYVYTYLYINNTKKGYFVFSRAQ